MTREVNIGPCRLIHGDCREVLPTLAPVDAVVTDPPYIGMKGGTAIKWQGVAKYRNESMTIGDELGDADAMPLIRDVARLGAIAFCSYHWIEDCAEKLGGDRRALLTWYKRNSPASVQNSPWYETEFAWAVQYGIGIQWRQLRTHFDYPMLQAGCFAGERLCEDGGKAIHPAQKPLALMRDLLLPGMESVCDPYMGLGTTGVACIQTERQFIGIEREEKYFEIACARIQRAWDLKCSELPFDEPPKFQQRSLLETAS